MAPEAGDQMSTKAITVRLDLDSKSDSIIWDKLQRIHKQNKLPYGKAVIYAGLMQTASDPHRKGAI